MGKESMTLASLNQPLGLICKMPHLPGFPLHSLGLLVAPPLLPEGSALENPGLSPATSAALVFRPT